MGSICSPVDVNPGSNVQMPVLGCSFLMSMKRDPDESCEQKMPCIGKFLACTTPLKHDCVLKRSPC